MLLVFVIYAALWTLYGWIARSSQALHPDMTELIAWSRHLDFGYLKHPPLSAWLVRLWFSLVPIAEWSFYLLAMLMPTIALWIFWRLSADYLDIEKCVLGVALLMFIPFYNFHALKFNPNTVLLPSWAATTFWFLRSYRTRSTFYSVFTGLGAGTCMLAKYWSVFLLLGLMLAAFIDPRRSSYFRSSAPWKTVAVGFLVFSPHLFWLLQHDFAPFEYALARHGAETFAHAVGEAGSYLVGSAAYAAAPIIFILLAARLDRAMIVDTLWPQERERRLVAVAFYSPPPSPGRGRAGAQYRSDLIVVDVGLDIVADRASVIAAARNFAIQSTAHRRGGVRGTTGDGGCRASDCNRHLLVWRQIVICRQPAISGRNRAPLARRYAAAYEVCRLRCRLRSNCLRG